MSKRCTSTGTSFVVLLPHRQPRRHFVSLAEQRRYRQPRRRLTGKPDAATHGASEAEFVRRAIKPDTDRKVAGDRISGRRNLSNRSCRLDARIAEKLHVDAGIASGRLDRGFGNLEDGITCSKLCNAHHHLSAADDLSYFTSDSGNDACGICLQDAVIEIGLRYPQTRLCRIYASLCHTRLGGRCIESLTGGCAWVKLLLTRALGLCVLGLGLSREEICFCLSHCVLRVLGIKAGENSVHFHEVAISTSRSRTSPPCRKLKLVSVRGRISPTSDP